MNGDGRVWLVGVDAEEDELAAGIHGYGHDGPDADALSKGVVLPRETLVESVRDVVGDLLVVGEDEDRSLVAVFPHVGILMHLLPGEASIAREERVRVGVGDERLSDVADGEHESRGGGRRVGGARILALGIAVDMKGAVLWRSEISRARRAKGRRTHSRGAVVGATESILRWRGHGLPAAT